MKQFARSNLGVTLLEVMLVLAIAAMIIVMSVRYYQSASASQQANSTLNQIQAITAIADGMAQSTGTYSNVNTANVQALMPNNIMTTAWGGDITIAPGQSTYSVTISKTPGSVCAQIQPKLNANPRYSPANCSLTEAGPLTYTYDSTK